MLLQRLTGSPSLAKQRRQGVAAVELAVVLPFYILLVIGIWEMGRMFQAYQLISNASREGARFAAAGNSIYSTAPSTRDNIRQVVVENLLRGGVNIPDVTAFKDTITIEMVTRDGAGNVVSTNPNADPSIPLPTDSGGSSLPNFVPRMAEIRVTVTVPVSYFRYAVTNYRVSAVNEVVSACSMVCMRDDPFEFTPSIPNQR